MSFVCCIVSDIEGTLELSELYSYVGDISTEDEPKPFIDDSPSKEDVKFMKMAQEVSLKSPDNSTKVNPSTLSSWSYLYMVILSGGGYNC